MLHLKCIVSASLPSDSIFKIPTIWLIWTRHKYIHSLSISTLCTEDKNHIECMFVLCKLIAILNRMRYTQRERTWIKLENATTKKTFSGFNLIKYYFNRIILRLFAIGFCWILFKHWHKRFEIGNCVHKSNLEHESNLYRNYMNYIYNGMSVDFVEILIFLAIFSWIHYFFSVWFKGAF